MFDIGWPELFVIVAVAVLVIGPEQIPPLMRTLGRVVRRVQYVRYAFSQQFEDFLKEHDLKELRDATGLQDDTSSLSSRPEPRKGGAEG